MERLNQIATTPEETAVIILGDAGINFYLNKTDIKNKRIINNSGFTLYCVRGNHEERPENLGYPLVYNEEVHGYVYQEAEFPNINYFKDGEEYIIKGYSILVLGGAYSVDKNWRLSFCKNNKDEWTGWFKDEQLTKEEMNLISKKVNKKTYDFIFSHTCPIDWEPTELFLSVINQKTVDSSMELWMNELKDTIKWNFAWCCGHFHENMLLRPKAEMFFTAVEEIETIANRWINGEDNPPWWIRKSQNYYMK